LLAQLDSNGKPSLYHKRIVRAYVISPPTTSVLSYEQTALTIGRTSAHPNRKAAFDFHVRFYQ